MCTCQSSRVNVDVFFAFNYDKRQSPLFIVLGNSKCFYNSSHPICCRRERTDRLQEFRWTHRSLPAHVQNNLSPLELQYFAGYDQLLNKYMRSGRLGVGLDLTAVGACTRWLGMN